MPNPIFLSTLLDLSTLLVSASPPEQCMLRSTHGTPLLLGDVTTQKLSLTTTGDCTSLPTGALLLVNSADNTRRADALLTLNGTTWDLTLTAPIPAPRDGDASVTGVWNLYPDALAASGGEKPLAQVMLTPLAVSVTTTTTAVYDTAALTEAVASYAKPSGVAYVLPPGSTSGLKNVASLMLPSLGGGLTWKASSTDATLIVEGADCKANCAVRSPSSLVFKTERPSQLPLLVRLEATRASGELFTISARLAESAAYSAVPLNIADAAYLLCQKHVDRGTHDEIRVNNLAAITNSAVANNLCSLVLSAEDIDRAIARQNNIPFERHSCAEAHPQPSTTQSQAIPKREEPCTCTSNCAQNDTRCTSRWNKRGKSKCEAKLPTMCAKRAAARLAEIGEARCKAIGGAKGEVVTLFAPQDRTKIDALKPLYGRQRLTYYVYSDSEKKEESRQTLVFSSDLVGRTQVAIDFRGETPSPDRPIHVEMFVQPVTADADLPAELVQLPERRFAATLRPKGPFGITHRPGSLGSRSVRIFVTIPVDFAVVRFPAAGLDIKSTRDSTSAQLATLTTGALLTFEPWDYTRATNMYAVPMRFQAGLLMSNWYKGVFHPSTYLGYAITLPVFRGTSQLDSDLALGFGWEVDLRSGYEHFGHRNHFLVTLGMNILSLFGPQSAPRGGK